LQDGYNCGNVGDCTRHNGAVWAPEADVMESLQIKSFAWWGCCGRIAAWKRIQLLRQGQGHSKNLRHWRGGPCSSQKLKLTGGWRRLKEVASGQLPPHKEKR